MKLGFIVSVLAREPLPFLSHPCRFSAALGSTSTCQESHDQRWHRTSLRHSLCALPQPSQAQLSWEGHSKNRSQMINKIILFQANLLPCDAQNQPSSPKKISLLEQGDTWPVSQAPRGKPNHPIPFYLRSWVSDVHYQRRKWNYWQHSSQRECAVHSGCSIVFTKHLNQYWCDYCLPVNFPQ